MRDLEGKSVLVTGPRGFIGSHLWRRLCQVQGVRLTGLIREAGAASASVDPRWIRCSLEHVSRELWSKHERNDFDVVFHLAAHTPKTNETEEDEQEVARANREGTRLFLASLPERIGRIVLASTLDVYATPDEGVVVDEDSPVRPASSYGASKVFCEELVREHAQKRGHAYSILRYGHVFGPGEEKYRKLIPETIRRLSRGEAPLVLGDGSMKRDFLYVDDAVEATLLAAVHPSRALGPINVVRGESVTVERVVTLLSAIMGFRGEPQRIAGKARPAIQAFDATRCREVLGMVPRVSLEEGLRREVAAFRP